MKRQLTSVLASLLLLGAAVSGPATSRAQTTAPADGAAPPPAAPAATAPAAPAEPPAAAPAAPPGPADDALPDDPAADEVVVTEEDAADLWPDRPTSRNIASVRNRDDGRLRVRGRIRLVKEHSPRAEPLNAALAYASCTDCQTFAVALEIALIGPNASVVAPHNHAQALNYGCERCVTVARAVQYAYVVENPNAVPENVRALMNEMERELRQIGREPDISAAEAERRVNAVIGRFQQLAQYLNDQRDEADLPTSPGAPPPDQLAPAPSPTAP